MYSYTTNYQEQEIQSDKGNASYKCAWLLHSSTVLGNCTRPWIFLSNLSMVQSKWLYFNIHGPWTFSETYYAQKQVVLLHNTDRDFSAKFIPMFNPALGNIQEVMIKFHQSSISKSVLPMDQMGCGWIWGQLTWGQLYGGKETSTTIVHEDLPLTSFLSGMPSHLR